MASKVVLQLGFTTDQGKSVHFNIANPKQPVDSTAVATALSTIVAKNIFALPQGTIAKSTGAIQVATDTTTIS